MFVTRLTSDKVSSFMNPVYRSVILMNTKKSERMRDAFLASLLLNDESCYVFLQMPWKIIDEAERKEMARIWREANFSIQLLKVKQVEIKEEIEKPSLLFIVTKRYVHKPKRRFATYKVDLTSFEIS